MVKLVCSLSAVLILNLTPISALAVSAKSCLQCHNNSYSSVPKISGQAQDYLEKQLYDFKFGNRIHKKMNQISTNLTTEQIQQLASYFAKTPWTNPSESKLEEDELAKGKLLANQIGCHFCHGQGLNGIAGSPKISGQHESYLKSQLQKFRSTERQNDFGQMFTFAQFLTDEDIVLLSNYIGSLK
jgi:cytochrome c553